MGLFSRKSLLAFLTALLFCMSATSAQAALYAPGETLDPACAPLDADCGVSSVVGTGVQGQIPYYAANGNILSATSSITILTNGNVGVGTTAPSAPLHVIGVEQENNTYRGLLIESPVDDNFWGAITIKAGQTANQRRYLEFKDHAGIRTNLMGFNASNSFIAFDAINQYHFVSAVSGSATNINSFSNTAVQINTDGVTTGAGGLVVFDGTANASGLVNMYGRLNVTGLQVFNGGYVEAFGTGNSNYTRLLTSATNSQLRGSLDLEISSGGNDIVFSDSGFVDKIFFSMSSGSVGIGTSTPAQLLQVTGANAGIRLDNTSSGAAALSRTMSGLELITRAMNNTTNSFGSAIKFMSSDPDLLAENPKLLAAIVPRATQLYSGDTTGGMAIDFATTPNTPGINNVPLVRFTIDQSGNVGIGTTTPWKKLSVTGTVGFDGLTAAVGAGSLCLTAAKEVVYNATSDNCLSSTRETKHAIKSLALSELEMLQELNPVSFVYNGDTEERERYGFIADEADSVDSHLVTRNAEGKLSGLDTSGFLALIVGAVQELSEKVEGFADSFTTKDLNAEKLCLGSTCVTEAELQQFLNQSNQQSIAPTIPADPEPAEPVTPQTSGEPPATPEPAPPIEEPAPSEPAL